MSKDREKKLVHQKNAITLKYQEKAQITSKDHKITTNFNKGSQKNANYIKKSRKKH